MNLLPEIEKKLLKKGLRLRFWILSSFMIVAAILVGLVALVPAYVLTRARLAEIVSKAEMTVATSDKQASASFLALPEEIKSKLKILEAGIPKHRTIEIFYELTNIVPVGVTLKSISFMNGASLGSSSKKDKVFSITGIAQDRKSLIDFSEKLKSQTLEIGRAHL